MNNKMRDYIGREELGLINFKLNCGDDVLIRVKGKNKVQIISQTVKVLKNIELEEEED